MREGLAGASAGPDQGAAASPQGSTGGLTRAALREYAVLAALIAATFEVLFTVVLPQVQQRWTAGVDLKAYLAAARIGLEHGWSRIYDLSLQRPLIAPSFAAPFRYDGFAPGAYWTPYATTPPAAWLLSGLAPLPFNAAWTVWTLVLLACLVASGLLMARASVASCGIHVAALLGTGAAGACVATGNIDALIVIGCVGGWALLERDRQVAAGLVLALTAFKPQVGLLVPPALFLAGYRRAALTLLLALIALALASVASLGPSGLAQYREVLNTVGSLRLQKGFSVGYFIRPAAAAYVIQAAIALAALYAAWRNRGRGPAAPMAAALLGALAASPYLNVEDLMLGIVALLLAVRAGGTRIVVTAAVVLWIVIAFLSWPGLLLIPAEVALIVVLAALRPRPSAAPGAGLA